MTGSTALGSEGGGVGVGRVVVVVVDVVVVDVVVVVVVVVVDVVVVAVTVEVVDVAVFVVVKEYDGDHCDDEGDRTKSERGATQHCDQFAIDASNSSAARVPSAIHAGIPIPRYDDPASWR